MTTAPDRPRLPAARLAAVGIALLLAAPALGQSLQSRVDTLVRTTDLGGAEFSLYIAGLDGAGKLAERKPDRSMIPASNMKLVTTAAALDTLGPGFAFTTQLRHAGRRLIVRGGGDPGFGDPVLLEANGLTTKELLGRWVRAAERTGREKFKAIVVDDRMFDRTFVHPHWPEDQLHKWYCAPVGAVNFNDNCVDLYASPTRPGSAPEVTVKPALAPVVLNNQAETGDRNAFWAARRPRRNELVLRGEVSHALVKPVHVTVHDPPMFFGETYQRHLQAAGFEVGAVRRASRQRALPDGELLAEVRTTLPTALVRCNRDSQNLFAEALFKRLGHELTGEPGSWSNGAAAVRRFLAEALGAQAASAVLDDGSGLSRKNRLRPRTLVRLLGAMHEQPELAKLYRTSLARPGGEGTLDDRFRGIELTGDVRAKSGYLSGVVALSGYLTVGDRTAAFSMLLNGYHQGTRRAKRMMEKIVAALDEVYAERYAEAEAPDLGG